jgi:hypothetical protein
MQLNDVFEKINKLKALADDKQSDGEKISALAKMNKLMKKYNLNLAEIEANTGQRKNESIVENTIQGINIYPLHIMRLGQLIAENTRCYFLGFGNGKKRYREAVFMGLKSDTEMAERMFMTSYSYVTAIIERKRKELNKEKKSTKGLTKLYGLGFVDGLGEAIQKETEALIKENEEAFKGKEYGLIALNVPVEVVKHFEAQDYPNVQLNSSPRLEDMLQYKEGYIDGMNFNKAVDINNGGK